jgi:alpha-L-fucosidase
MNRRHLLTAATRAAGAGLATRLLTAAAPAATAAKPADSSPRLAPRFGDSRDWWFERRFGMFVHWGLYAIQGWHEQDQWRRHIPRAEYQKLAQRWNPAKFDPEQWLDLAEEAGMGYLCLTTKHHDGFCLFESKLTDYHTVNTPYGKDIVGLLAEACHRRKFPLCLYYSIADWHHPAYPNQGRHHELRKPEPGDRPDWDQYLEFLRGQIRELCTNYGAIHGIWWDMNVPKHREPSIHAMIRQLQPQAVINDRGFDDGDFGTPERDYTKDAEGFAAFAKRTEACQSVGRQSWGWREGEDYYSDRHLLRSIDKYRARDANYLLNVGPKPDGTIAAEQAAILRRVGRWYRAVKESFAPPCPGLVSNKDILVTRDGNNLYVHLAKDPECDAVQLKPLGVLPRKATLLNDGSPVDCAVELVPVDHAEGKAWLRLRKLPVNELVNSVLVVKLEFDRDPGAELSAGAASDPNAIHSR